MQFPEGQPLEHYEEDYQRMISELQETPKTSTPKKRKYKRKIDFSPKTAPKNKKYKALDVKTVRAPRKMVILNI